MDFVFPISPGSPFGYLRLIRTGLSDLSIGLDQDPAVQLRELRLRFEHDGNGYMGQNQLT
jgi:hypothetical protein